MTKQEAFDNYMKEYLKLNNHQKEMENIEKAKVLVSKLVTYYTKNNIPFELLRSREINDISDNDGTSADYLEATMVYLQEIEELLDGII